jgi:DNA-binding SARP family transcriptional activator/tetratricopeptide (TPR) repeat protein
MATEGLRFAVYGGPRVLRGDTELELGPPQRRLLLALLMLAAGGTVSMDLIVETLWDDDPPDTALNVVHRHVGQLRRVLEPELTSRQPGGYVAAAGTGYRLHVTAEQLDLLELRSILAVAGDHPDRTAVERALLLAADRAGARLPAALAMESLLAPPESDRVAAGLLAAALATSLGDVQEARRLLPAIQAIAHDHPFDEPMQAALVRTLVAAGRRADALAHYGSVRALMDEELGLEPGPDLQAAQRDALADSDSRGAGPTPTTVVVRPHQLPVHPVNVVGRDRELAEVTTRLRSSAPVARVCALTGMGGVGKTTLALQCAQDVTGDFPDGQLYTNLHGYDAEVGPAAPGDVLRGFLVALGVTATELPDGLDDRASLFRSLVAESSVLVVLDNARDSAQVAPLLPGGATCAALVTSRRRLDDLAGSGATMWALERLDEAASVDLLRDRVGSARVDAEPDAAARIVTACDGLPLALAIVAARAARWRDVPLADLLDQLTEPSATLETLSGGAPATDLRRVFSWSYDALPHDAAALFRCTGVQPGADLSLLAAASLAGVDVAAARRSLDVLARASLVSEVAPSRYQAHDLLRAYAHELLDDAEAEAARRRLVDHYVSSARNAYLLHGRPALYETPPPSVGASAETFRNLGEAQAWYLRERRTLAALVQQTAAAGQALETALLVLDVRPLAQQCSPAGDLLPLTRAALDAIARAAGPALLAAELRRDLGLLLCRTGHRDRGHLELEGALAEFEALDDATGQSSTLRNLARSARFLGDADAELVYARRSVEVARHSRDPAAEAVALTMLTESLVAAGRLEEATVAGERSVELARTHQVLAWEPHALEALAQACAARGDYIRALQLLTNAREADQRQGLGRGSSVNETRHQLHLAEFQYGAGDHAAALASYQRYLSRAEAFGPLSTAVAVVEPGEMALGDLDRVRRRIAELGG